MAYLFQPEKWYLLTLRPRGSVPLAREKIATKSGIIGIFSSKTRPPRKSDPGSGPENKGQTPVVTTNNLPSKGPAPAWVLMAGGQVLFTDRQSRQIIEHDRRSKTT